MQKFGDRFARYIMKTLSGPPGGEWDKQSAQNSGGGKVFMEMLEDQEDGLGATSRSHYAQSMYHCTYQPAVNLMIVIVNSVLFDYLFQENKSYGSKKPFAFILWCTRSPVEHRDENKYSRKRKWTYFHFCENSLRKIWKSCFSRKWIFGEETKKISTKFHVFRKIQLSLFCHLL
jgi:hypothetical protein